MKKILIYTIMIICLGLYSGCARNGNNKPGDLKPASPAAASPSNSPGEETERLYQKAKDAQQSNEFDEATAIYKKILEKSPNHYRARKRLGEIYYLTGEYEPAIREFKIALEQNPPNGAAIKSNLVLCYLAVDRPESAISFISKDIDEYSRWGTHYSFLAQADYSIYMMEKKPEVRKRMLNKIRTDLAQGISQTEDEYAKSMLKASLSLFEGKRKYAGKELLEAYRQTKQDRDRTSIMFLAGALAHENENTEATVKYFKQVLESSKNSDSLDPSNLMDCIYAYWYICHYDNKKMKLEELESLIRQIRGGIREPETEVFTEKLKEYIGAYSNNNYRKAAAALQDIENSIMDESIEGDYLYSGIYKPFILQFLYKQLSDTATKAKMEPVARKYKKMEETEKMRKFPD
jgi:tetratricopeptide (TPR) repeat protein